MWELLQSYTGFSQVEGGVAPSRRGVALRAYVQKQRAYGRLGRRFRVLFGSAKSRITRTRPVE